MRAKKMGRTPGENRPNFDICPVFAVKKGNKCTKQRHRNNGRPRNNVMDTPGTVYMNLKMGENAANAGSRHIITKKEKSKDI